MSRFPVPSQDIHARTPVYSVKSKRSSIAASSGAGSPVLTEHVSRTLFKTIRSQAPVIRRLVSFLFIGGLGAALNLLCFSVLYDMLTRLSIHLVAYIIAFSVATELSLLHNFLLNDWMTFRNLRGRRWTKRCFRFHITSIGGALLTLGISFSLFHFLEMPVLVAQGTALVAATLFNFVFHHIFTYA